MNEPKPKHRRWYQFSLRTLLLFVSVCAVPFAWVGWKIDRTRREQVIVTKIEKWGGRVWYHEVKGPDWLARHFRKVKEVSFIRDTCVTGARLEHLKGLTSLEYLNLYSNEVTDVGLEHLKGLTSLESLDLSYTKVAGGGLEHLKGLTNLDHLSLTMTQVTDAGLEHLKGLPNLKSLYLRYTQVTDEGVEKLQQALPNCKILH